LALYKAGDIKLAIEELTKARAMNPNNFSVLYHLGLALCASGDLKSSIEPFNKAN